MLILKGIDQLTNAIAKAKKIRPRVEFDHFGRYRVSGSKGYYTVNLPQRRTRLYKQWLTPVKARRKAWFAITQHLSSVCTSDLQNNAKRHKHERLS